MNDEDTEIITDACGTKDIERKAISHYEHEETRRYYLNQKIIGFILLLIFLGLAVFVDPIFIVVALPCICIIKTKKMVIVNDYWREHGGSEQWN